MKKSRIRVTPTSNARLWSRREVLARGAGAASVLALPQLWVPKAWGLTVTFDYYISTTGSDSNAGTLASPWAITAINTKQSTYAGKRVGLLPGTYDISGLMRAGNANILQINGGTVSVPTYIGTSDANGNYSRGTAILDCKGASGYYGGGPNWSCFPIGSAQYSGGGPTPPNWGNWILDGIVLTGYSSYGIAVGSLGGGGGPVPNVTIQNCIVHGGVCTVANEHPAPIILYDFANCLISNCWIYDNINTAADSNHWAGINANGQSGNSQGLIVQYCTFSNSPGIYGIEDQGLMYGATIQNNYFDLTNWKANFNMGVAVQGFSHTGSGQTGTVIRNNIVKGGAGIYDYYATGPWTTTLGYYNNTWDLAGTTGQQFTLRTLEGSGHTGIFSCYNNLMYDNGAGAFAGGASGYNVSNADGFAVCDYNIYGTKDTFSTYGPNGGTGITSQTFASWKNATGADAHSSSNSTNPFTNAGSNALQYTVQSGSPAYQAGRIGGTSGGAICNVGAWDGTTTQIGCSFAPGGTGSGNPVPVAPKLMKVS